VRKVAHKKIRPNNKVVPEKACFSCGKKLMKYPKFKGNLSVLMTFNMEKCDICGKYKAVTGVYNFEPLRRSEL